MELKVGELFYYTSPDPHGQTRGWVNIELKIVNVSLPMETVTVTFLNPETNRADFWVANTNKFKACCIKSPCKPINPVLAKIKSLDSRYEDHIKAKQRVEA